jgi:predicted short-subunit dehydrogenase-like oxidoreductase (DUF2520 family)
LGQVPAGKTPLGLVGSGRLARHFRHYFDLLGLPFRTWSRRESTEHPSDALASCDTVLLLVRDDAIEAFVDAWPALRRKRLVHCSGSLLTSAAEAAHPLMTFGPSLYGVHEYRAIPFVLDAGGTPLPDLLPGLPNPWFTIPRAERPLYHALCVMAGNFSTILWTKLFDTFETRFDIPRSAAFPYLRRMTTNLEIAPGDALTGPLARGDVQTMAANLKALEGDAFHAVYAAFARIYDQRS